jgi:translation initiation factor 3 subunit A
VLIVVFTELLSINAKAEALTVLHASLTRRSRGIPQQQILEKIMLRYLSLCVELRKPKFAKDGLHQYKGISQQFTSSSKYYVRLSEMLTTIY